MTDLIKGRVWPWEKADLIARLLAEETDLTDCAADHIEALVKERDYTEGTNDTLIALNQALEAKLTKAVAGLRKIADYKHFSREQGWIQNTEARIASATLAELEVKE